MSPKILIADDEPHILKIMENRLKANGYNVITASDGEQALEKVLSEKPDLIIVDILMPKMDGYSFVKKIKADPVLKDISIIVFSAKDRAKDLLEAEGIDSFISKPCRAEELLEIVVECLKKKEKRRKNSQNNL